MRIKDFRALLPVIAVLLSLSLVACRGGGEAGGRIDSHPIPEGALQLDVAGTGGGVLKYSLPGEPATFNPTMASDTRSQLIVWLTSATLLQYDPVQQSIRDGLAASHRKSEDGLTIELELRRGLRFSDGVPLTTEDVLFTFERLFHEDSASSVGRNARVRGEPLVAEKTGTHSVAVHFPAPTPGAEHLLASIPILPRHKLGSTDGPLDDQWTLATPPAEMAGLGPFTIASHEPGLRTTLRANPHYWKTDSSGQRLPYLNEIVIEYVGDRNAQLLRLQAGELDLLDQSLRPEDLSFLEDDSGLETDDIGPSANLALMWFNLAQPREGLQVPIDAARRGWFQNADFRRAVSSAIDRNAIVDNIYLGRATAALSMVPPTNRRWHVEELQTLGYDTAAARSLFDRAGFALTTDGAQAVLRDASGHPVRFEMLTRSDEVLGRISAVIQQDLAGVGIEVTLRQEDQGSVISRITASRDYEAVLFNLDLTFEADDYGAVFRSDQPMHLWDPRQPYPQSRWESRLDELMSAFSVTVDPVRRRELFAEAQGIVAAEAAVIPLVNRNVLLAWNRRVGNLRPASQFPHTLWNSWELFVDP